MEINRQAPLSTHKEVLIQAPPEVVWNIQTNINAWSQWQPTISAAKLEKEPAVGSTFTWKTGGITITSTIREVEPQRRIAWTGKGLGTEARHIWILKPEATGTRVITEESMEGWLVQIMKLFMPKFLDDSLDTWLLNLKRKAEGNSVTAQQPASQPTPVPAPR
jgi:uncharacterized protein YndB with AHSA1/START domain